MKATSFKQLLPTLAATVTLLLLPGCRIAEENLKTTYSLNFDAKAHTTKTSTVAGKTFSYRAYEGIVYVTNPVDTKYQTVNIYIPSEYYADKTLNGWTAETAPIFLPNSVGGYFPGLAGTPGQGKGGGDNATLVALSKGLVVAAPGARGRTTIDASGTYTGKAPAAIVDLKAAVRYLRFNDKVMPGNAERIVSNGTSAGGALSALLGASGNNADYEPFLKALGAAPTRDDIFAVSAYCPITNLDNADSAYEWIFNTIHETKSMNFGGNPPAGTTAGGAKGSTLPFGAPASKSGPMSDAEIKISGELKALFPAYLNSLKLQKADGSPLILDASGNGNFRDYVKSLVIASAQKALDSGTKLTDKTWITIKNGKVTDIRWEEYLKYYGRKKGAPSFDALDASSGENNLFGTDTINNQHFTAFGLANNTSKSSMADASVVKMMNPLNYLGTKGTTTASNWRIRHGTADSDTSLAIPTILATELANAGYTVDFFLPWDTKHSGDYDLEELFAWISKIAR